MDSAKEEKPLRNNQVKVLIMFKQGIKFSTTTLLKIYFNSLDSPLFTFSQKGGNIQITGIYCDLLFKIVLIRLLRNFLFI